MIALEITGLVKRYGRVPAVADVSLVVPAGEIVALVGPNGAGKSTVMKSVVGLIRPTAGEVIVAGHRVTSDPVGARRLAGYVPQRIVFIEPERADRVLAHYAALRGINGTAPREALTAVGLGHVVDRPVNRFSGGMMQRLGLAVALLGGPPLLVLDEPMVSLDPDGAEIVRRALALHRARGGAVLIATHLLSDAELLADRVCLLAHGRVVADDTVPGLTRRFAPSLAHRLGGWRPEASLLETVYRAAIHAAGETK